MRNNSTKTNEQFCYPSKKNLCYNISEGKKMNKKAER